MTVVVPAAVLPPAYAGTAERDHHVLGELLELPVTVFDPLTAVENILRVSPKAPESEVNLIRGAGLGCKLQSR